MSEERRRAPRLKLAGAVAVLVFLVLAGRYWHPTFGLTKFLELDPANHATEIAAFRRLPVYVSTGGGYDGQYYAQIAYHPLLRAGELKTAIDDLNYRARRILPPALAWVAAGGNPTGIVQAYCALNIVVWLGLAWLLWWALPVTDARRFAAWAGILFSAGAAACVRLALTDLLGATLLAAAIFASERNRRTGALAWLGLAGLARETALAGVGGIWTQPWLSGKNVARTVMVVAPVAVWMAYIRWSLGPGDAGLSNFTWPVLGWVHKWEGSLRGLGSPDDAWLAGMTLMALAGLTVQVVYMGYPRPADAWWRVGAVYVVMMLVLGRAVWEGYPGAAFRTLLPLTIAFNVMAGRRRGGWGWLVIGNLGVVAGFWTLADVPDNPTELAAIRDCWVTEGAGWYPSERSWRHHWAWSDASPTSPAIMRFETWPKMTSAEHGRPPESGASMTPAGAAGDLTTRLLRCTAVIRSLNVRHISIREGGRVLWHGEVAGDKMPTPATFEVAVNGGQADVAVAVDHAGTAGEAGDPRALAFAMYDLKVAFEDEPAAAH